MEVGKGARCLGVEECGRDESDSVARCGQVADAAARVEAGWRNGPRAMRPGDPAYYCFLVHLIPSPVPPMCSPFTSSAPDQPRRTGPLPPSPPRTPPKAPLGTLSCYPPALQLASTPTEGESALFRGLLRRTSSPGCFPVAQLPAHVPPAVGLYTSGWRERSV